MPLIDETNILKFLLSGGKFIYAGTDYAAYTSNHVLNAIHLPGALFRSSKTYPNTVPGANAIVPVQPDEPESIKQLFNNAKLSVNDHICVYGEPDGGIVDTFFVIYNLQAWGFKNIAYLNTEFRQLNPQFLTQDYPVWEHVCEDYTFVFANDILQAQEYALLNKFGQITPLDVRPPNAFAGNEKRFKVNGHAPNSVNVFWKRFFVPSSTTPLIVTNKLIPIPDIVRILSENGITQETNTVLTCNTGSEISVDAFILRTLLGWNNVKLFIGSWNVYQYLHQIDPEQFPVVTGL